MFDMIIHTNLAFSQPQISYKQHIIFAFWSVFVLHLHFSLLLLDFFSPFLALSSIFDRFLRVFRVTKVIFYKFINASTKKKFKKFFSHLFFDYIFCDENLALALMANSFIFARMNIQIFAMNIITMSKCTKNEEKK